MTNIPPPVGLSSGTEVTGDIHEGSMPSEAPNRAITRGGYPNRSDLRAPGTKPIRFPSDARHPAIQDGARPPAPPGYKMLPSVSPGQIPAPPAAQIPGPVLAPTVGGRFAAAMQAAKASPLGAGPGLTAPSAAPAEHVMTGAPAGPGAGPGILGIMPGQSDPHQVLGAVQARYGDPDMTALLKTPSPSSTDPSQPIASPLGPLA